MKLTLVCYLFQPDAQKYTVIEGQSINISFRATVPVGCMTTNPNLTSHCFQNLFIHLHQDEKDNVQAICENDITTKDIIFKAQFCGIKLSTTDWKEEKNVEVFGLSDGLYNTRGRSSFICASTSSVSLLNEHWHNITIPYIQVCYSMKLGV